MNKLNDKYYLVLNFNFPTFIAISLSLVDSNGPVLSTIEQNTDCCFCIKLNGVSNSITLPNDKTYKD